MGHKGIIGDINKLEEFLIKFQIDKNSNYAEEINLLLIKIFQALAKVDYEHSKEIRRLLFDVNDRYYHLFFLHLLYYLSNEIQGLIKVSIIPTFYKINRKSNEEIALQTLMELLKEGSKDITLFQDVDIILDIPDTIKEDILALIFEMIQHDSNFTLDRDTLIGIMSTLPVARHLAKYFNQLDSFYNSQIIFIQRMNHSYECQLSRDWAENVFLTSLIDKKQEWGYLALLIAFNGHFNINYSLIYALSCIETIKSKRQISDLVLKLLLLTLLKFYRNIKQADTAEIIYKQLVTLPKLSLSSFDIFDATLSWLMIKLTTKDSSVVYEAYTYMVNNKEVIFNSKREAYPLLNVLYNIKFFFIDHPDISMFDDFLKILEMIVGENNVNYLRATCFGNSHLKEILIDKLVKLLLTTRDKDDFVSEIKNLVISSSRLIDYSFKEQDVDSFLFGMILKCDYSWVFINAPHLESYIINTQSVVEQNKEHLIRIFSQYSTSLSNWINLSKTTSIIWLGEGNEKIFFLTLQNNCFSSITYAKNWDIELMNTWLNNNFEDLRFEETVKLFGQVMPYLENEQIEDLNKIKSKINFANIEVDKSDLDLVLIIKDIELSQFPHNLILNHDGKFISQTSAITCIPSIEWFRDKSKTQQNLTQAYSKSLWIPLEAGDYTLNALWSRLENKILSFNINCSTESLPKRPLSSDINIITAHGSVNISMFQSLATSEEITITDLADIVGNGQILILFVCHSGSMKNDFLRVKLLTFIRQFLESGYQTVIAPFWSLHISIPPIWLPTFLESIEKGNTVSEATFNANNKVFEINKNPGAWACLHLYGNPFLKIE